MTTQKSRTAEGKGTAPTNAIAMLKADHAAVGVLFATYDRTRSAERRADIVQEICTALSVHAQIEEEIFYPAVRNALRDRILVPEAIVEHAGIKDLIAQIAGMAPEGEMFDAKVKVLSEYVTHHVKEEQDDMFPKARTTQLDMVALGALMAARKGELLAEHA